MCREKGSPDGDGCGGERRKGGEVGGDEETGGREGEHLDEGGLRMGRSERARAENSGRSPVVVVLERLVKKHH